MQPSGARRRIEQAGFSRNDLNSKHLPDPSERTTSGLEEAMVPDQASLLPTREGSRSGRQPRSTRVPSASGAVYPPAVG